MKENDFEIREGTREDADTYVEFFMESAIYHSQLDNRFQYTEELAEKVKGIYTSECDSQDSWTGFAILNTKIVGYITALIRERGPIHEMRKIGFIEGLYVIPDVREQGIGNRLWMKALQWLENRKIRIIHLSVASENPIANDFWRKKGFRPFIYQMEINLENEKR